MSIYAEEYKVDTIGTHTLVGMLVHYHEGVYKLKSVEGKDIIVHYYTCAMSIEDLAREVHTLYNRGAAKVTLIEWERAQTRYTSDGTEVRIPARAVDPKWRG